MFRMVLGCKIPIEPATVVHEGLFEVFKDLEKIERVFGTIIPARDSTGCKCRRTARCSVNCFRAVSGILVGHKINWIEGNARL